MKRLVFLSLLAMIWSQANIDFSYEMKYGNGSTTEYGNSYFENLLDINTSFKDNISIYSQLEYSDPPLFGQPESSVQKLMFEYFQDNFTVTVGDLVELYGYGLAINMSQDQSIGFDNSLRGLSWTYDFYDPVLFGMIDGLSLFGLIGKGSYDYALNASTGLNTRNFDNLLTSAGFAYYGDLIPGELSFWYVEQESFIPKNVVQQYHTFDKLTFLEEDFVSRMPFEDVEADTVIAISREASYSGSLWFFDFYVEKMWSKYNKLMGNNVFGSMLYTSVYASLGEWGVTWDYKDYDMPYYVPSVSNPPTVFREASSTLVGRVTHNTLFNDETGHQFEINRGFSEHLNFLGNLSFSRRHVGSIEVYDYVLTHEFTGDTLLFNWEEVNSMTETLDAPGFSEIALFDLDEQDYAFYPYSEIYGELSGYLFNEKLYWMMGFDKISDITKYHHQTLESYNDNGISGQALNDLVFDEYSDYWWGIWDTYYQAVFDTTTADWLFDLDYNASVDEKVNEASTSGVTDAQAYANQTGRTINSYNLTEAITIPTNFAWNMGNGNSLTAYFDQQWITEDWNKSIIDNTTGTVDNLNSAKIETYNIYLSLTQRLWGKYSFSLLYDFEDIENKTSTYDEDTDTILDVRSTSDEEWLGYEFAWDVNPQSQISVFYGSIKGGRVCANGICAEQPGFEDGIRVTFRSIF